MNLSTYPRPRSHGLIYEKHHWDIIFICFILNLKVRTKMAEEDNSYEESKNIKGPCFLFDILF